MDRELWITRPGNTEQLRQRMMNIGVVIVMLLALLFMLGMSACSENADDQMKTTDIDTLNPTVAPGGSSDSSVIDQHTIDVTLSEYSITMPEQAIPGPAVFRLTNSGSEDHGFELEGNGDEWKYGGNIPPGQTQTFNVELKAGTYQVYCPVGDHRDKGMSKTLTVQ